MNQQALIEQLQSRAGSFDPAPPAGLERKVAEALAAARRDVPSGWSRHIVWGVVTTAAAIVLAVLLARPDAPEPGARPEQTVQMPSADMPNPMALAQKWVDDPMEAELRALMQDLSRTTDTVTRILPAPKPARHNDKSRQGAAHAKSMQA